MDAPSLVGFAAGFLLLALLFGSVEAFFRSRPGPSWWRRAGTRTDLLWFAWTSVIGRVLLALVLGGLIALLVVLMGGSVAELREAFAAGRSLDLSVFGLGALVRALPLGVQFFSGLLLADFIGYWTHRAFHRRRLWRVHAVHHSSTRLDWLSSVRVHPLNTLLSRVVSTLPLLLLGFDPAVFASVAPALTLYGVLLHANVGWTFGPFRYVLASPAFHRWHHTAEEAGFDKNFAGLCPLWDLAFGTWYLPARAPTSFGTPHDAVPEGFWGQMLHPFRRAQVAAERR